MEAEDIPSESAAVDSSPSTIEEPATDVDSTTAVEPEESADPPLKTIDRAPLPFHLSLLAVAPWKSLVLIALALVFGWADWRFAQTWRVPAEVSNIEVSPVKMTLLSSPCYMFTVRATVLDASPKDICDRQFQFGSERISRLRVSAFRGNEKPLPAEDIPHSPTEKSLQTNIFINGVTAQQTTYVEMGRRYIEITIPTLPKIYKDKLGAVKGLQLTAPYGDNYDEKSTIDGILRDWKWQ
jgi:hypothetical protein